MPLKYKIIRIYTDEDLHWHGKPVYIAIIEYIRGLKLAARCLVQRGIAGCYENGDLATQNILDISYNLPITIEIILPAAEIPTIIPKLEEMLADGIITVTDLEILAYKSSNRMIPQRLKVKEIMTVSPKTIGPKTPLNQVVELMLKYSLKGVPVVDSNQHPLGIITQNDLITKAGMPVRLGLVAKLDQEKVASYLNKISGKTGAEIMNRPLITVKDEQTVREAVQIMIKQHLKRLPVVDKEGVLVGMLSRFDIFRILAKQAPEFQSPQEQNPVCNSSLPVKTILQRDLQTVQPETPIPEVIEKINANDVQRIAVVDREGKFLGLISDNDLLPAIIGQPGFWEIIVSKLSFTEKGRRLKQLVRHARAKTAAEVMLKDAITINEEVSIDEAIRLMTKKGLKRLPVVDGNGVFKGLISRDSVLQAVFQ